MEKINFEERLDLKQFCSDIPLIVLPSTLWSFHIDPQYQYVAVVHLQVQAFSKIVVDKGILLTDNQNSNLIKTSLFIQNELIRVPKLTNHVSTISELSGLIQFVHELKICPNFDNTDCNKYVEISEFGEFCDACTDELNLQITCRNEFEKRDIFLSGVDANMQLDLPSDMKENSYLCKICNSVSDEQSVHERHLKTHNKEKLNLCNICGKTFYHGYRMKEHLLTHSMERPFECDTCQKVFTKSYSLKLHQKTHSGIRSYVCSICGKTYTTQSNLTTHVRSVHTKEKPHACSKCNMSFVHPRHLRLHMFKHTGEKPFSCVTCGKSFAKKVHLTIHLRTHTGEKPHLCVICRKGFTTTGNLSAHKRIHHKDEILLNK